MYLFTRKGVKIYREFDIDMEIVPVKHPFIAKIPVGGVCEEINWKITENQKINKYDVIATINGDVPIYSPFSGTFTGLEKSPALGRRSETFLAKIETERDEAPPFALWETKLRPDSLDELIKITKDAAIVDDITGEYFYQTLLKAGSFSKLIVDCVDDQPYDLSSTCTLLSYGSEVAYGADIISRMLLVPTKELCVIKNFRTEEFFSSGYYDFKLTRVSGKYPSAPSVTQYAKKTGAMRVGVQTCRAVFRAVVYGEPQTSKIVTAWGNGLQKPHNLEMPIGVPISDVLEQCSAYGMIERIVSGGVMTGYISSPSLPLMPDDNCLTVLAAKGHHPTYDCINCGRCAAVCPALLAPYYILRTRRKNGVLNTGGNYYSLCTGCGSCSYICPARQPLKALIERYNSTTSNTLEGKDGEKN